MLKCFAIASRMYKGGYGSAEVLSTRIHMLRAFYACRVGALAIFTTFLWTSFFLTANRNDRKIKIKESEKKHAIVEQPSERTNHNAGGACLKHARREHALEQIFGEGYT